MTREDEVGWEVYAVYDRVGNSHAVRRPKGKPPQIRCVGCDE